jgi:hypothetical protein
LCAHQDVKRKLEQDAVYVRLVEGQATSASHAPMPRRVKASSISPSLTKRC